MANMKGFMSKIKHSSLLVTTYLVAKGRIIYVGLKKVILAVAVDKCALIISLTKHNSKL